MPFALTVDFKSLEDATVTVRERDSTSQVRTSRAALAPPRSPTWVTNLGPSGLACPQPAGCTGLTRWRHLLTHPDLASTPSLHFQIRVPVAEVAGVIRRLVDGAAWDEVSSAYPAEERPAAEEQQ